MLLYLESQLEKAYRVYITKIPIGQTIPDLEFFREMMEEMNDAEYFDLSGRNLPDGYAYMNYTILNYVGESWLENSTDDTIVQVSGGKSELRAPFDELDVGEYRIILLVQVYNQSDDLVNASLIEGAESLSKEIDFELEVKGGGFFSFLPFVDSESHREVTVSDPGPRTCWTTKDLGEWGYLLMAAELGGGRETAMLTGGTAGILSLIHI